MFQFYYFKLSIKIKKGLPSTNVESFTLYKTTLLFLTYLITYKIYIKLSIKLSINYYYY